ncbi:PucR family transcriptional regulator [Microbacterium sp. RD1]|uniref:PucR family transcriptional regulator n=1 Tax=Microbacterium sp. RD1 TaxID=3457313 RepID=UPI003FA5C57A
MNAAADKAPGTFGDLRPQTAALLRDVAKRLETQVDEIADTMIRTQQVEIPAYADMHDTTLLADARSVSVAVVKLWLMVMATGRPLEDDLLVPVSEGARRRAAQGVGMEPLLQAYRLGIRVMWTEITSSPAWHGDDLAEGVRAAAAWVLDFADRLTTAVAAAYVDESAHLARDREHRRSSLLNLILAGPSTEQHRALADLTAPHSVVVAQVSEGESLARLEAVGMMLERHVNAYLWTVRHSSVVAVVFGSLSRAEMRTRLDAMPDDGRILAFGLGNRASSPAETRVSYAEASEALQRGPALGTPWGRVYDHSALAPLLALLREPATARRFAATTLEPFAPVLSRRWVLPTLDAFVTRRGRLGDMAAHLDVHPNTVKYRMSELQPYLSDGALDGDQATTLLLAIRVHRYLEQEG